MSGMEHGLSARFVDRAVANARAIRGAPEAIALVGIVRLGVSYFAILHFHRESVAALNEQIDSQERLLAEGDGFERLVPWHESQGFRSIPASRVALAPARANLFGLAGATVADFEHFDLRDPRRRMNIDDVALVRLHPWIDPELPAPSKRPLRGAQKH
jgi:hypothetical protein